MPRRQLSTVNCQLLTVKGGVTTVELLTALALFGLISVLIASVYFAHFRLFQNQNTAIEISSQNKIALDEIVTHIRESESVVNTCTDCGGDTSSATTLVLRLWPLSAGGEPTDPIASQYDYTIFKRDGQGNTKLIRKSVVTQGSSRTAGTTNIASSISDLAFTYDNTDPTLVTEVNVTVTTTGTSGGKTHTTTQGAKAVLRNK